MEKKELTYKNITLTLWLDTKPAKKKNHLWQFIYVNKRPIQFGLMHSILVKNLGFSPSYAIFIETKQENLDVNVHPAKTEVKFFDKAAVLSILTTLLKSFEQKHVLPDQLSTGVSNPETFKNQTNNTSVLHPQYGLQCFPSTEENICVLSDNGLISAFIYFDRLLHHVFTNNSLNLSEDNAVALLITKSFSYSKKHLTKAFLDYWSQLGLRLAYDEREQKWILHTIPNLWPLLNYGFIVESIIQKNLMNLATLAKHIDCSKCVPPENIALILEHTEREKLVKERILIPLKGLL